MKSRIKLDGCCERAHLKIITFPGGEVNVSLMKGFRCSAATITVWLHDSEGVMALAQLKSILDDLRVSDVSLVMGYVPYARQDRICNKGESLSIKVFASIINNLEFSSVTILDPHSDVTPALIDNVKVIDKSSILSAGCVDLSYIDCFVAPDFGASKEIQKLCIEFNKEFIQGVKVRDTKTGQLSGFDYYGDIKGKKLLIVDDLCDGGGTFIGLAKKLQDGAPDSIDLYVTHGMFTKGMDEIRPFFGEIYTTNTFISDIYKNQSISCIYKIGDK